MAEIKSINPKEGTEHIRLQYQKLNKTYTRSPVFKNLNGTYSSCILGIAGPNGSGKSTLLRCFAGLLKPTSGSVIWKLNDEMVNPKYLSKYLGYSAPYIQLYEELTVLENLKFINGLRQNRSFNHLSDHLKQFGAESFSSSPFGELSTGQQQRAKLAAATFHDPSILCLDEPGSNLDEKGRNLVYKLIESYKNKAKMLLIATNLEAELQFCDQVIEL